MEREVYKKSEEKHFKSIDTLQHSPKVQDS